MSEPFPSPEYIKLCTRPEVAEKLREEWEPKFGDWVYATDSVVIKSCVNLKPEWRIWVVVAARPKALMYTQKPKVIHPPLRSEIASPSSSPARS